MALFTKQDFKPVMLSRKWFAMKFRPNMLLFSHQHIISILESGLLFREDSIEVEQEAPAAEEVLRACNGGWMTTGEKVVAGLLVGAGVLLFPPRSINRATLINLAIYTTIPLSVRSVHRRCAQPDSLRLLLAIMRQYLALARRAAAALKECAALHHHLSSISCAVESTRALLCRQQSQMAVLLSRASSALLGNAPWLRSDLAWEVVERAGDECDLMKIHHTFLVVQSTLLKHIAMAHFIPSVNAQRIYKNHNERIYWLHTVLIPYILKEYKENQESLERMYRLLKNYGTTDFNSTKKLGTALNDSWMYSEVHSGIAKANLELKVALKLCTSLDMFLDSSALNNQEINNEILNKDIEDLIVNITKSLNTVAFTQMRLRKIRNKLGYNKNEFGGGDLSMAASTSVAESERILKIEDSTPEAKDEVFYCVKSDDGSDFIQPAADVTTGPGLKEKQATETVLNELRRKLVHREDLVRERERQALIKTMDLKGKVPEFPRQMKQEDWAEKKGCIKKLQPKRLTLKPKFFRKCRLKNKRKHPVFSKKVLLKNEKYEYTSDIEGPTFEALVNLKLNTRKISTITPKKSKIIITKWNELPLDLNDSSVFSCELSEVSNRSISQAVNQSVNQSVNHTPVVPDMVQFNKHDLDLSLSSDSECDLTFGSEQAMPLLDDIRRHRAARKKNFPTKWGKFAAKGDDVDESMKPVEYSFGTGMAMASVLQVNKFKTPYQEEVFIGDGEVSGDSGNDEDE